MADNEEINESDCCGNGCANCVLNIEVKKSKVADLTGKINVLDKFTKFRLLDKILHSSEMNNVWELHFKSKEPTLSNYILDINPGYHIMMRRKFTANDEQNNADDGGRRRKDTSEMKRMYLLRPYSPFWWDGESMEFKILVNLNIQGPMSDYIRNLYADDEVEVRGPIGTFEYTADSKGDQQLVIVSQGIAIAPVISIIENILHDDEDLTRIAHLACFQDVDHIYFRDKLYAFQKYWNYKTHIYLAHEMCNDPDCVQNGTCVETCKKFREKLKYKEPIHPFRLNEQELEKIINPLKGSSNNVIVVIAGTGNFQMHFKDNFAKHNFNIYLL